MIPIKSSGDEPLEVLLNKATSPLNAEEDWLSINGFCDRLNDEPEGPVLAVKLLAHKIQSPQEKEALYALTVLEMCVQRCGQRFHQEIGKFRFLNEIIKVISPKYLGQYTTERVKLKCIAMLYSWTDGLTGESKIKEAYQMLKSQGIIKRDPTPNDTKEQLPQAPLPTPPPPRAPSIFGQDEEKAKQLSRLLKSRNPTDLAAANRMIKAMVKEDNDRVERLSKRMAELETVRNNTKLLSEMLNHYRSNGGAVEDTEIMRELLQTLEAARPNLVRLARETDENDNDGITEILQVNDAALEVIKRFQECNIPKADPPPEGNDTDAPAPSYSSNTDSLQADLLGLDNGPPPAYSATANSASNDILSRDLADLGLGITATPAAAATTTVPTASSAPSSNHIARPDSAILSDIFAAIPATQTHSVRNQIPTMSSQTPSLPSRSAVGARPYHTLSQTSPMRTAPAATAGPPSTAFDDLSLLGKEWVEQQIKSEPKRDPPEPIDQPLVDLTAPQSGGVKYAPLADSFGQRLLVDLSAIDLPISEVRPNTRIVPRTLFERPGGLRLQIHFTENRPALRVRAFVLMLASSYPQPVTDIDLVIEPVSADTRIELKSAGSTELAPFNPFAPQVPLNHILLVESAKDMDPIVVRFRLEYTTAGNKECETGESDNLAESAPGAS